MIAIDGSQGEGGGQILRTALALSVVTGKPFTIRNIRARRAKPGLMRQHLTAVKAAAEISGAQVGGADVGATALTFEPGAARSDEYTFRIGSAGSTTLVLQTVLPPLALAGGHSRVTIEGGTHNMGAPPFDFLDRAFLPLIRRMGFNVTAHLKRPGFYPAGGGVLEIDIAPLEDPQPLVIEDRGTLVARKAEALIANLPRNIAERELAALKDRLGLKDEDLFVRNASDAIGPGNCLVLTMEYEQVCEVVTAFGRVNATSEAVAGEAAEEAQAYLATGAPVGSHLADQLILPMALARGGRIGSAKPSPHTLTNIDVVKRFLDVRADVAEDAGGRWSIAISR